MAPARDPGPEDPLEAPSRAGAAGERADPDPDWLWMADDPGWVPPVMEFGRPTAARVRDCLLHGKDHSAVDRAVVEDLVTGVPDAGAAAQAGRAFLMAAVQAMAGAGIRQFIDLRCGLPRDQNVHDVARARCPDAVIVYVDSDPVVIAHVRALIGTDDRIAVVDRDLRDPEQLLAHPRLHAVIDYTAPIGLLMVEVLPFIDRATAPAVVTRYVQALPPGSQVAISAACQDQVAAQAVLTVERVYAGMGAPVYLRSRAEVEQLFGGLRLNPPGLTDLYRTSTARILAGIATKD
jgi:hypothetical protein